MKHVKISHSEENSNLVQKPFFDFIPRNQREGICNDIYIPLTVNQNTDRENEFLERKQLRQQDNVKSMKNETTGS